MNVPCPPDVDQRVPGGQPVSAQQFQVAGRVVAGLVFITGHIGRIQVFGSGMGGQVERDNAGARR